MSKKYPMARRPNYGRRSLIPYQNPNIGIPTSIIPKFSKDHNIAGQVSTRIHLKNARGEEMTIYQNQQLLNLLRGARGNWHITDEGRTNRRKGKRR